MDNTALTTRSLLDLPIVEQAVADSVVGVKDGHAVRFPAPPSMVQFARTTGAEMVGTANGSNLQEVLNTLGPSQVVPVIGGASVATPATAGGYFRFTATTAKTFLFSGQAALVAGTEYTARNVGATDLTLVGSNGFVLRPPAGGTLVVPQGGTVTIKIISDTEADVIGVTNAA